MGRKVEGVLVFFHCPSNTGYAIRSLERSFFEMAVGLTGGPDRVHFSFTKLDGGLSSAFPGGFSNVLEFDPATREAADLHRLRDFIRENRITLAFGMDQPVHRSCYKVMRGAGVGTIISYWGAPSSSLNRGVRLLVKKLEVQMYRHSPDHFIYESRAMALTATNGRGIPDKKVSVVYLGIDPDEFTPGVRQGDYLQKNLGIPSGRKVVVFSGHMEERKGVRVLISAARELVEARGRSDVHLLVIGNRPNEERPFLALVADSSASSHVTFGGYRNDLPAIFPNCSVGAIASTGWDSFTVSALEMASAGLPLVVSELQGLAETVEDGRTGFTFPPGDVRALADRIEFLLDDDETRALMGQRARERILEGFTRDIQVRRLQGVCRSVMGV